MPYYDNNTMIVLKLGPWRGQTPLRPYEVEREQTRQSSRLAVRRWRLFRWRRSP